jgi:hypothetical protein
MSDPGPSDSEDNPIILRANNSVYVWFAILAVVCAFALLRGYLAAGTTGGQVEAIIVMGVPTCLFIWIVVFLVTRRPTISISASAITYAKPVRARTRAAGDPAMLVIDRSLGRDLTVVANTPGRRSVAGLTIRGSGTTLPISTFDFSSLRRACLAKGWQFTA